jgi:hypothetical protein
VSLKSLTYAKHKANTLKRVCKHNSQRQLSKVRDALVENASQTENGSGMPDPLFSVLLQDLALKQA